MLGSRGDLSNCRPDSDSVTKVFRKASASSTVLGVLKAADTISFAVLRMSLKVLSSRGIPSVSSGEDRCLKGMPRADVA